MKSLLFVCFFASLAIDVLTAATDFKGLLCPSLLFILHVNSSVYSYDFLLLNESRLENCVI